LAQPLHQRMNDSMLVSPLLSASSTCRPPTQQPAPRGVSAWWNAARGAAPHQAEGRPLEVAVLADLLVDGNCAGVGVRAGRAPRAPRCRVRLRRVSRHLNLSKSSSSWIPQARLLST
jgi:hypothetical protein